MSHGDLFFKAKKYSARYFAQIAAKACGGHIAEPWRIGLKKRILNIEQGILNYEV
jgi:hypothetical protein